jgi:hypothetical protein
MAKIKKAQKGDSLTYSTTGRYAPKQRVAVDTTGYASGKKEFTATSELSKKPRKVGRKLVDRTIGAMKAGKIKKAQSGEKLKATRIINKAGRPASFTNEYSVDTSGYAAGKKRFPATKEITRKPSGNKTKKDVKVGRSEVKSFIKDPVKTLTRIPKHMYNTGGEVKKAQFGSTEGGRCGISRAAARDARKSERDYAKQSRQAEREQKREVKAAARQAKRTPSMRKGGKISKNK